MRDKQPLCAYCKKPYNKTRKKQITCHKRCMGKYLRKHTNEIIELYDSLKVNEIAEKFFTSPTMIFKILQENYIPTKTDRKNNRIITNNIYINLAKDLRLIK